ncbi:hypothetical protein [Halobellus ordinarius]|uniref:hypothetical protein n=1 Tax=Halobellus ordinarius TaxID=3075120 RepID=UPI0028801A85|nr:hypothetical protein [Halobellus sp. ZY16]
MFNQQGYLHNLNGEYEISFSLEDITDEDGIELTLDLNISVAAESGDSPKFLIQPREAQAVEPSFVTANEEGDLHTTLKVFSEDDQTELGIQLSPWVPGNKQEDVRYDLTHISLLSAQKLELCTDVIEKGQQQEVWDRISELYQGNSPDFLFDFTTEARRVLDFKSFVALMSDLSSMNYQYGATIGSTRAQFFKNMMIGDSGGIYHRITSYQDLQRKLELFSKQESLEPVDEDFAIKLALRDLEQDERFEELYEVLNQVQIAEERPNLLYDHQLEFYIAKSQVEEQNLPISAVTELATEAEVEDYDDAIEDAKLGGDTFEETANLWRDLISPSIEYSHQTLQFVLGRYLHWKTRVYTQQDDHLELAPILNYGAAELSTTVGDKKYAQLSKYNQHLRQGFNFLSYGHLSDAINEFEAALSVAINEKEEWYEERSDLMVTPLQYKTLAEVSGGPIEYEFDENQSLSVDIQEVDSKEIRSKLSLLKERITLLEEAFEGTDISVESAVTNLRAKQFRLLANQRISTRHYELAIEAINEVISLYAQLGDDDERDRAIGFKEHITAVLAETQANFDNAADSYSEVAENSEYVSTEQQRQYHSIRSKICRAKSELLRDDIEKASEILEDIRESVSELKYEAADLSLLIDLLNDFNNTEKSPIDSILANLSEPESEGNRKLSVSFDYKPAATAILSAQRLKTRGVNEDLLRRFIKVGVAESFTPDNSEEVVSDTGLSEVSIDTVWRNYLPIYTHRNLERIEIKENSSPTGDYSDVASKLFSTFEKYLEVIVEYYGEVHGSSWKEIIAQDPEKDLTLGDLVQFFQMDDFSDVDLEDRDQIAKEFNRNIIRGMQLVKIRNELDHGHIDILSEEEYEEIKSSIVQIFEKTAPQAPIILQPKSHNTFGSAKVYSCELFWSHPQKQASVETQAELNLDSIYFMAPECSQKLGEREIVEIKTENIVPSSERRVVEAVT